jgi:nucleoside-diphosphate-sugar epimerase
VSDVAWAVVQALETPATINRQFNISGAAPLTYNDVVRLTAQALCRRVQRFHIPAQPMVAALQASERLGITLPIKAEQVLRLNEDKAFSHAEAAEAFGYFPMAFEQGIRQEVALLRSGGDGLSV